MKLKLSCSLILGTLMALPSASGWAAEDRLVLQAKDPNGKHIVLISGDEEYRSEESMPMLGKILSQKHGFKCTVLFAFDPTDSYIDSNNQTGLRGLDALDSADLMIIGTRFRRPDADGAKHIAAFLNAKKPVIGIRTSTHAFRGGDKIGGITYDQFGRKILGEQWVSHHGQHKRQGARGVIEKAHADHAILRGVKDVFCPSDVYGVVHLTDADQILLRGAVTESLDPESKNIEGKKNDPMQPFAWLHEYTTPDGKGTGKSFCTTAGASVDFVNEDLRRMIVNAAYFLTDNEVPAKADVEFVDEFQPAFYGFIRDKSYWPEQNLTPAQFGLGKSPVLPDPKGSPEWNYRKRPATAGAN